MGKPITRLNPQVESAVQRILLVHAMQLLMNIALLFSERKHNKRGQQPYDYRIVFVLCILRILLLKTYASYEIEIRTDSRICNLLDLQILPGKSTIQRAMNSLKMKNILELNRALLSGF